MNLITFTNTLQNSLSAHDEFLYLKCYYISQFFLFHCFKFEQFLYYIIVFKRFYI